MSFSTFKQKADSYYEFLCDEETDLQNLPTDCAPGSIAFVVNGALVYMLNNKKQWISLL